MWTLVNAYGATKGGFKSYEVADSFRLGLDDWWLWEVVNLDEM